MTCTLGSAPASMSFRTRSSFPVPIARLSGVWCFLSTSFKSSGHRFARTPGRPLSLSATAVWSGRGSELSEQVGGGVARPLASASACSTAVAMGSAPALPPRAASGKSLSLGSPSYGSSQPTETTAATTAPAMTNLLTTLRILCIARYLPCAAGLPRILCYLSHPLAEPYFAAQRALTRHRYSLGPYTSNLILNSKVLDFIKSGGPQWSSLLRTVSRCRPNTTIQGKGPFSLGPSPEGRRSQRCRLGHSLSKASSTKRLASYSKSNPSWSCSIRLRHAAKCRFRKATTSIAS